jgi:hypothetical protein
MKIIGFSYRDERGHTDFEGRADNIVKQIREGFMDKLIEMGPRRRP